MIDFAQKLISAAQIWSSEESPPTSNSILKSAQFVHKPIFRIGVWPITSASDSQIGIGMGIGLVLAALLEQWPSVRVYRLVTQVTDTLSNYQWKIEDTQFSVDDWEIEGLDENVAIWGTFAWENDQIILSLKIENDAREDDSVLELNYEFKALAEVLNQLPVITTHILNWLDSSSHDLQKPYEIITAVDSEHIGDFLEDIFLWEVDYFLELWGKGTEADDVLVNQDNLITISNSLISDFGAWMISEAISRFILFDQIVWSEWLLPTVKQTGSSLNKYPVAAIVLASAVFRINEILDAFDILETSLSLHPKYSKSWMTLGDMYVKSGEDLSAIDVYQRSIESHAVTTEIYLEYASLMDSLVEHRIDLKVGNSRISAAGRPFIERYVLTDEETDLLSLRESCASYRHVFELDSSNTDALAHLVNGLLSLHDAELWKFCTQLVNSDKEGAVTASFIEQLADEDIAHVIDILETAHETTPQELGIHLNLVRAYLADGQNKKAKSELATVPASDVPILYQSVFSRLRLEADDPEFPETIREIQDILNTNGKIPTEDVDFLEAVVEKEPLFSEGYILLAKSYLNWDEPDDALEVLLDGQKTVPFDSDLIAVLATVLWNAGEADLALGYINQGLKVNDHNATLLSLMGRFLFDNGEDEIAKDYLRRAEAIDPVNETLSATRLYIASVFIKNSKV